VTADPHLPPTHFRHAPWSSTKKRQNNDIFFKGINMVRMIILKRRMHLGIAVNAAVDDLPRLRKSPPPPQLITPLPSVDTRMGTPRRQWEKGSTPIKTHPPSPCTTCGGTASFKPTCINANCLTPTQKLNQHINSSSNPSNT